MHYRKLSVVPLIAALSVSLVAASIQSAAASPRPKAPPASAAPRPGDPSSKMPAVLPQTGVKGYRQVSSDLLSDPAGQQVNGTVSCPTGTNVVGGGAIISGTSLFENLNGSFPSTDGVTWIVYINNASAADGTFRVYADCATNILSYSIVSATGYDNGPGHWDGADVKCPIDTKPLGGGGVASSTSIAVNLTESQPSKKGWGVGTFNNSNGANKATAFAVCGTKPSKYYQVQGISSTVAPGAQGVDSVTCPPGTLVLGGGGVTSAFDNDNTYLNSSAPTGNNGWIAYENNTGTTADEDFVAWAICAKAAT